LPWPITLAAALALAAVHLVAGYLRFLDVIPRSRWLSFAGGVSVAYVFVALLPEISTAHANLSEQLGDVVLARSIAYFIALGGIVVFYGLEILARRSRREQSVLRERRATFWIHISSFAIYNLIIGEGLEEKFRSGPSALALFVFAMALHFLVNDYGLRVHYKRDYRRIGRWLIAGALLAGWALGETVSLPRSGRDVLFAFLAGGVILNTLKEELPEERRSRFWAFGLGALTYGLFLTLL
jgi:zinc transporter ZupT